MFKNDRSQNSTKAVWTMLAWTVMIAMLLSGCGGGTPQAKVYHVGVLSGGDSFDGISVGFKTKMAELGYVEGKNIVYDMQKSGDMAQEKVIAQKFVADKVDLIFAFPAPAGLAAKAATQGSTIPVVFAYGQIEGSTLVKSVREPGDNITGVRYPGPELIARRLDLLLQIAPQAKRVWVGYQKSGPNTAVAIETLRQAATKAGVTLVEVAATVQGDLAADLAARASSAEIGMDAILTMPDPFNTSPDGFAVLSKFAAEHKIPVAGGLANQVETGAIFANGTDFNNVGILAAPLVDKVLRGAQAGTIPVVTPEQTLTINYKVAQQLGLTVPQELLSIANKVIK